MKTIGTFEAKTHFSALLDQVAEGETITITKHGRPAAMLVPPNAAASLPSGELAKRFQKFRQSQAALTRAERKTWVEEGRK